jgi:Predicted membrane protein
MYNMVMSLLKKYDLKIFILITILFSMVTCMVVASTQQIWFDESYSVMVAEHDVSDIVSLASVDVHPPFYYLVLHFWGGLFNFSETACRFLSVLFYSLSLGLMVFLIAKLFNKKIAIMSVPILLVAPFLLRYGFEIRMYSLASLIAVGSTLALFYAHKTDKNKYWLIYAGLLALGMYTLYMSIVVFAAQLIWLVFMTVKYKKKLLKQKWIMAYALAVLLFAPWVPVVFQQIAGGGLSTVLTTFGLTQLLEIFSFGFLYTPAEGMNIVDIVSLIIAISVTVVLTVITIRKKTLNIDNLFLLGGCFTTSIIVLALLANPVTDLRIYIERYFSHFIVFGYAGFAVMLAQLVSRNSRKNIAVYVTMVLVLLFGVSNLTNYGNFNFQRHERPGTQEIAQEMNMYCEDEVIVDDLYIYIELYPYMQKNCNYKYWSLNEEEYGGGYAPLNLKRDKLILGPDQINAERAMVVTLKDVPSLDLFEKYGQTEIDELYGRRLFTYSR